MGGRPYELRMGVANVELGESAVSVVPDDGVASQPIVDLTEPLRPGGEAIDDLLFHHDPRLLLVRRFPKPDLLDSAGVGGRVDISNRYIDPAQPNPAQARLL